MQHEPTTSPTRPEPVAHTAPKVLICPYCGETQPSAPRCKACGGFFEALSRQATHNAMGPWFMRDDLRPFQPGCSYETLVQLVARGRITKYSIVRGPTTRQFWTVARHVPGLAHLLGYCHACDASVDPSAHGCPECGEPFGAYLDRNQLGLPDVRPLPGEVPEARDGAEGGAVPTPTEPSPGLHELPAPALPSWSPPVRTPRGLSSFVDDEQLLRDRAPIPRPANGARSTSGAGSSAMDAMDGADAEAAPRPAAGAMTAEDLIASPAVRSMQRRLARQDRTIRTLVVLLAASIVSGAAVALVAVMRSGSEPAAPARVISPAPQRGVSESPSTTTAPPPFSAPVEEDAPEARGGDGAEAAAPATALAPPAESEPGDGRDADYRHALDLLDRAEDGERPLDERMTACEEGLRILQRLAADLEPASAPGDLGSQIARAEELVERLELKAFFP